MKVLIPVAVPVSYNPAYYMKKAFIELGVDAEVIDQGELYNCTPEDADLFFGVDSGGPLNIPVDFQHKSAMWFIDSRRNHNPEIRTPDDDTVAIEIIENGGVVFQAQLQDAERLKSKLGASSKSIKVLWLPLASDPDVWSNTPIELEPKYQCAFVGNCYDSVRLDTLNKLTELGLLHWPGIEKAIMEDGASVYRNALCGLNIPSFYDTSECYDVNMRVFEILSCGVTLITNWLPELALLGFKEGYNLLTYKSLDEIPELINAVNNGGVGLDPFIIGDNGRSAIIDKHTYKHRAELALTWIGIAKNGLEI